MAGPIRGFPRSNAIRVGVSPRFPGPILGTPGHPLNPVLPGDWVVNGNPSMITQVDAENLLKAADTPYRAASLFWFYNSAIATPAEEGFRLEATGTTFASLYQNIFDWMPPWVTQLSYIVELKAGESDGATLSIATIGGGNNRVDQVEIISGPGTANVVASRGEFSGLLTDQWTKVRVSATDLGAIAGEIQFLMYTTLVSSGVTVAGEGIYYNNVQACSGLSVKPRPVDAGVEDWMMAYRPHNRLTGDEQGRFHVVDSEGKVWLGLETDTAAPPTSGTVDGVHLAGGIAAPITGDPGVWLTKPDGAAFDVGCGDAVVFRAKTIAATRLCQFGFDSNTSGTTREPRPYLASNLLRVDTAGGFETDQVWTAGETKSFLQLLRSDTIGSQFLIHDSAKQWKRFNVNADPIPAAAAYPAISNYNAELYVTGFGLMDLKANHEPEWVEVIYEQDPAMTGYYNYGEETVEFNFEWTQEDGFSLDFRASISDGNLSYFNVTLQAASSNRLRAQYSMDGEGLTVLNTVAAPFTDGLPAKVTITVDNSGHFRSYYDGIFLAEATLPSLAGNTKGYINNTLVTNDLTVRINRFPALGGALGATDRIVSPQNGDTVQIEPDSSLTIGRNIDIAVTPLIWARDSVSGQRVRELIDTSSRVRVQNYTGENLDAGLIDNNTGAIEDGDDYMTVLDGTNVEVYASGVSLGSSPNAYISGAEINTIRPGFDSYESWPLFVELVDPTL